MTPHIVKIASYEEFLTEANRLGMRGWVYRGHSSIGWVIESTLSRFYRTHQKNIKTTSYDIRERDSIRKFQQAAHHHLQHLPAENDWLAWLAIMQHFGAPTRLVDFTYSPVAAAYFAVEASVDVVPFGARLSKSQLDQKYRPFVVHALHLDTYRTLVRQRLKAAGKQVIKSDPEQEGYCIGRGSEQAVDFIGFYEGLWHNQRQIAQQGLFMVPSRVDLNVEAYLAATTATPKPHGCPWIRFELEGGRRSYKKFVKNLIISNNMAANLFPGLEGVARGLYFRMYEVIKELP